MRDFTQLCDSSSYTITAKPIKMLELHYPMIQFLIITHTHSYKVEIKKGIDFQFRLQNSPHFRVVQESASGQTKSLAERSRLKTKSEPQNRRVKRTRDSYACALRPQEPPPPQKKKKFKKKTMLGEDRLFCSLRCTTFLLLSSVF